MRHRDGQKEAQLTGKTVGSGLLSVLMFVAVGLAIGVTVHMVRAATYQPPSEDPPGGNVPITIWNFESSGTKQVSASIDIDGDITLGGEISSPSGLRKWTSESANGNFRMTQQDGGSRYGLAWNVDGDNLSTGTYFATGDPALFMEWDTGGFTWNTAPAGTAGVAVSWYPTLYAGTGGRVAVGHTGPGYPLDIWSTSDTAMLRLNQNTASGLWTGVALARQMNERWFIGMDDAADGLLFRSGGADDAMTLSADGDLDTLGCFGPVFVGVTALTYTGHLNGAASGYFNANSLCAGFGTGAHVCSTAEMLNSIKCASVWPPDKLKDAALNGVDAWVQGGPPGFTAPVNDCQSWSSNNSSHLGRMWRLDSVTGGTGFLTTCNQAIPFACCK